MSLNCAGVCSPVKVEDKLRWIQTTQQPPIIKLPPMWPICYCIASSDIHGTLDWAEQQLQNKEKWTIYNSIITAFSRKLPGWMTGRCEWCDCVTQRQLSRKCNIFPVWCQWGKCGGWVGSWEPRHDTINSQQYLQISTPVTAGSSGQH